MKEVKCEWCGKIFEPHPKSYRSKYCRRECQTQAFNAKRRERKNKLRGVETGKLDEALDEARAKGITYSEYKKQLTLAKVRNDG